MSIPKWVENLPEWATYEEERRRGYVVVDPDVVYPKFLKEFGLPKTQNGLEAARRGFAKMLRKDIVPAGEALNIRISEGNRKWSLVNFEVGDKVGKVKKIDGEWKLSG